STHARPGRRSTAPRSSRRRRSAGSAARSPSPPWARPARATRSARRSPPPAGGMAPISSPWREPAGGVAATRRRVVSFRPVPPPIGEVPMFNAAPSGARLAALALVPALAGLLSCASAPKLPPKAGPDEVAVYDPNIGQFPPDGYKAIGPIRVERPMGTSHADLILALRIEAAKLGADGIIIERIEIGRASCRETEESAVVAESLKKKRT